MFDRFILRDNAKRYRNLLSKAENRTIYHRLEYLLAEEQAENYPVTVWVLTRKDGSFAFMPVIVRKINDLPAFGSLKEDCFDAITPHEYSGVASNTKEDGIFLEFYLEMKRYCEENSIIFQFMRLNPYLKDKQYATEAGYCVNQSRQVYIDLKRSVDEIWMGMNTKTRNKVRQSQKTDLYYDMIENERGLEDFIILYRKSMSYLNAKKFLYFNEDYFRKIMDIDESRMILIKSRSFGLAAASIILLDSCNKIIYYHLSCFERSLARFRPMNYLIWSITEWGKENGFEKLHLGGGQESLYQFKSGFSGNETSYFTGFKIHDEERYGELNQIWRGYTGMERKASFLPQYRADE